MFSALVVDFKSGEASPPPTRVVLGEATLNSGRTRTFRQVVGPLHTHLDSFPATPVFRFPYDLLFISPATRVEITQIPEFFTSDLGVGGGIVVQPGPGVNIYEIHLRSPADNQIAPAVEIVPDPFAGAPFLVTPTTDFFTGSAFIVINFLIQTPAGPAQMHQLGSIVWPGGGQAPIVSLEPSAPEFIVSLAATFTLNAEERTLEETLASRLGRWELIRTNIFGQRVIPLTAKRSAIETFTVEPIEGGGDFPALRLTGSGPADAPVLFGSRWDVFVVERDSRLPVAFFTKEGRTFSALWNGVPQAPPAALDPLLQAFLPVQSLLAGVPEVVHIGTHVRPTPGAALQVIAFFQNRIIRTIAVRTPPVQQQGARVDITSPREPTQDLTRTPVPVEPIPLRHTVETATPPNVTDLVVTVTDPSGRTPQANEELRFEVRVRQGATQAETVEFTGGHMHPAVNRPLGRFRLFTALPGGQPIGTPHDAVANPQGEPTFRFTARTNTAGQIFLRYTATHFGGLIQVDATPTAAGRTVAQGSRNRAHLDVRVPGLHPLLTDTALYQKFGGDANHPGPVRRGRNDYGDLANFPGIDANHYGTTSFNQALRTLFDQFRNGYFDEERRRPVQGFPNEIILVNDMSLPKGGRFDLAADWNIQERDHEFHRLGTSADINLEVPSLLDDVVDTPQERYMQQLIERTRRDGSTPIFLLRHGQPRPHWHLYFSGGG